jgi:hypothetical protein
MGFFNWLFGHKPSEQSGHTRGPLTRSLPRGRFGQDRHGPQGAWVQTTNVRQIVGIQHRRNDVEAFCQAVHSAERGGQLYGVNLRPEPHNTHDRNAIAVDGFAGGRKWHVGYLDRNTAEEINRDLLSKGVPIDGELYAIWIADDGYIEIKVIVLAPPGNSMKVRLKRA